MPDWKSVIAVASRHPLKISLFCGFLLAIVFLLFSPDFKQCFHANDPGYPEAQHYYVIPHVIGVTWWCGGIFAKENGEAITALGTIAIAAFTATLWVTSRNQAGFMKASVEHMRATERAFVFLEDFDVKFSTSWPPGGAIFPYVEIVPRWKNSGATPTRNLELRVSSRVLDTELPDDFDYFYQDAALHAVIGPKATEWTQPQIHKNFPAQAAISDENGLPTIYIWGDARYQDIFGNAQRFTEFCYRLRVHDIDGHYTLQFSAYGPYNRTDSDEGEEE